MNRMELKTLFIGNSHTHYNDMAFLFKALASEGNPGLAVDVCMIAHDNRSLGEHRREPEVRFNILYGGFHYVVLQQSAHPFPGRETLFGDALALIGAIDDAGAKPVLYMTWAEKDKPWNQREMTDSYTALAAQSGALLCPAGECWRALAASHPEIDLYGADGAHANPAGSYLTACAFYAALFGRSPVGLSGVVRHGSGTVCDIPRHIASVLQEIAWQTVRGTPGA